MITNHLLRPQGHSLCGCQKNEETDETPDEAFEVFRVDLTEKVEPEDAENKINHNKNKEIKRYKGIIKKCGWSRYQVIPRVFGLRLQTNNDVNGG